MTAPREIYTKEKKKKNVCHISKRTILLQSKTHKCHHWVTNIWQRLVQGPLYLPPIQYAMAAPPGHCWTDWREKPHTSFQRTFKFIKAKLSLSNGGEVVAAPDAKDRLESYLLLSLTTNSTTTTAALLPSICRAKTKNIVQSTTTSKREGRDHAENLVVVWVTIAIHHRRTVRTRGGRGYV